MPHRRRRQPSVPLAGAHLALLRAVARGEVVRDDCHGERVGMWALYRHGDDEVGMAVRYLHRLELVDMPLLGPPRLNAHGLEVLEAVGPGST